MWAYVDETGNTGNQLFDTQQPFYITAAIVTSTNFDAIYARDIKKVCKTLGTNSLHAKELGVMKIEHIAPSIVKVLKSAKPDFFVSRLEKRYLNATKIVDTYFDQGENLAVPWHVYSLKPLRLMLTFKLATFVVSEDIARTAWECLVAKNKNTSTEFFIKGAQAMLENVKNIPDDRSREIVANALEWAKNNPENFSYFSPEKSFRYMHSPNFVAFTNLMDGLQRISKKRGRYIREIVHDEQQQFKKTLTQWHELISRPDLEHVAPLKWPGEEEPITVSKAPGSKFRMIHDNQSAGLQVTDIILWLIKQMYEHNDIPKECARLLNLVLKRGYYHDFSFSGVGHAADEKFERIMSAEIPVEQFDKGQVMLREEKERRTEMLRAYAEAKYKK